jgi:MFS family permease
VRYKTILIAALALSVAGGAFPMLFPRHIAPDAVPLYWRLILASRVIVGLCCGVFFTLPAVLIMRFYTGLKQKIYLGAVSAFGSASGLPAMLAAGALVDVNWSSVFAIYLAGTVPLVFVLFGLPEPENAAVPLKNRTVPPSHARLPLPVVFNFVLIFLAFTFWIPAQLFISNIISARSLGSGFAAGVVSIMFNISSAALSFLFAPLHALCRKYLVVVVLILDAVGMALIFYADSLFMAGAGMFLLGSIMLLVPAMIVDNSEFLPPERATFATAMLTLALNLGLFAAGPFSNLTALMFAGVDTAGGAAIAPIRFACAAFPLLALLCFAARFFQKPDGKGK